MSVNRANGSNHKKHRSMSAPNPIIHKPEKTVLLQPYTIVDNRYRIIELLGSGSFGQIFDTIDLQTQSPVAIKVSISGKELVLDRELKVMKHVECCDRAVKVLHSGKHHSLNYVVMERLGENLTMLRRSFGEGEKPKFSLSTSIRLGLQMLECVEAIHKLGYVHRDVKPNNFVINLSNHRQKSNIVVHIIDFGCARRYLDDQGQVIPPRSGVGFRGTIRYASINAMEELELGPQDDLWSVFYSIVEFATGELPWVGFRQKSTVLSLKRSTTNECLVRGLPRELVDFMYHLQGLNYEDEPDYDYLKRLLQQICDKNNFTMDQPYDWQLASSHLRSETIGTMASFSSKIISPCNVELDAMDIKQMKADVIRLPSRMVMEDEISRTTDKKGCCEQCNIL
jgi:serine/threonine protein kinase